MYKVIKEFPGYKVGDLITEKSAIYYDCHKYPDLFEKIKNVPIKTEDGLFLNLGEKGYYTDENLKMHIFKYYSDTQMFPSIIFKNLENFEKYVHSKIYLKVEDGEVIGENIILYGVCCKAEWNLQEVMSFKLFKSVNFKDSWKFFISKDNRNKYVLENKPRFSNKEVNKLMIEFVVFTDNYKCGLYPQDYTLEKQLEIFKKDYYEQSN